MTDVVKMAKTVLSEDLQKLLDKNPESLSAILLIHIASELNIANKRAANE